MPFSVSPRANQSPHSQATLALTRQQQLLPATGSGLVTKGLAQLPDQLDEVLLVADTASLCHLARELPVEIETVKTMLAQPRHGRGDKRGAIVGVGHHV